MNSAVSISARFREARERAGLSPKEAAARMCISSSCVWDIEANDKEIGACYSPAESKQFCEVLGIRPAALFAVETTEPPISAEELVRRIHEQVRSRGVSFEQFEDAVGWRLAGSMEPPERLLQDMTIDGLQWLCRELSVDWHRVILSL